MKYNKLAFICTVLVCVFGEMSGAAFAGNSWQFQFAMKADKDGGVIKNPAALYIDQQAQRYYVVDSGAGRLLSFTKEGEPLHSFNADGKLNKPIDMLRTSQGSLLVVEKGRATLTSIDLKKRSIETHTLEFKGKQLFPQRLAQGGLLYFIDKGSGSLFSMDDSFSIKEEFPCEGCRAGFTDFILKGDTVYGLSALDGDIFEFSRQGQQKKITLSPQPSFPVSFALHDDGSFFVVQRHVNSIAVYDGAGRYKYSFLSQGYKEGGINNPIEARFDPWGRLCVVEEGNGRVSVFER